MAEPAIAAGRRHIARLRAFMRARLARNDRAGLRLTWSVLLFIAAMGLFAAVAEDVVTGDPLVALDLQIAQWFHARATFELTRWMLVITNVHNTLGISILGATLGVYLAWRRQGRWLLTLAVVLPGGMLVNLLLKQAFQRGRPHLDDPLLSLTSFSFPSGHVAAATLFYGVLAAYLASRLAVGARRWPLALAAAGLVGLVGLTRIYLGVHFFSDVVAAAAWSTAWLVMWLALLDTPARA